jgi:acyl-CoA synthetase (AMP-forming)/AMP-acid ligase II
LDSTIVDILRARAEREPGRTAYSFLQGRSETTRLTYLQLIARAQNIASAVHESGNSRVVLVYPPGLEFIAALFGCMVAGVVPIPVYPLIGARPERSVARIRHIAVDAGCTLVLTTETMLPGLRQNLEQALPGTACLATDLVPDSGGPANWTSPAPDSLAILQYTSGSTALPRGVLITHRNLMANSESIRRCFGCNSETPVVSWLPPYHDMGLIGGILQPLFSGCPVTLMSPHAFLQNPGRWLEVISETRAVISPSPNFGYDLCARKVSPETLERLDLRTWKVAICGAEPVNPSTLHEFGRKFEPAGFRMSAFCPSYGLAEATLLVSASVGSSPVCDPFDRDALESGTVKRGGTDSAPARILTGNGCAAPGISLRIVDPTKLEICPEGTVGEIWVNAESVSEGYWNKPSLNREMFRAHTAVGEGPFLRTGDTGFISGGQLFIAGRIKDLIILGGKNHFPEDLEMLVRECHPAFAGMPCAAFPVDIAGQETLVIAQEVARQTMRPGFDPEDLFRNVHRALFTTNVRADAIVLLRTGTLPRTSSGKVQRHVCRIKYICNELDVWAEWRSPRAGRACGRLEKAPG